MSPTCEVHRYWWSHLLAVPTSLEGWRRLRRVWFDHTGLHKWFVNPTCESHLTATLFENFSIFAADQWVKGLVAASNLQMKIGTVSAARWAYEVSGKDLSGKERYADVAIHFHDEDGDGVILIEAKSPGGVPTPKDLDPHSYLDLDSFAFTPRRRLIYLVDSADLVDVQGEIVDPENLSSMLSWQQLGGLQIRLAHQLSCEQPLRDFIAGSIQYQFAQHCIRPTQLSAAYLATEPSLEQIDFGKGEEPPVWKAQDWKLPDLWQS